MRQTFVCHALKQAEGESYLGHGYCTSLSKGIVIEVEHTQTGIVLHCSGQSCDAWMIDPILRHVNLLKASNQLNKKKRNHKKCINLISD